tara:strand:+ start:667 stop:1059 length:393 start_codon:yes stop_codon:yes gene_type:complete
MKPTNTSNTENIPVQPAGLRILRILTIIMTIVMIFGFILVVSLLSIAIRKNINTESEIETSRIILSKDTHLLSTTYSSDLTILLLLDENNTQILRIVSNKTGKILSNNLISDLIKADSKNHIFTKELQND